MSATAWDVPTSTQWWDPEHPADLVARFRGMSRRDRKAADELAARYYRRGRIVDSFDPKHEPCRRWGEAVQDHPSFERVQEYVWLHLPRRWRGRAIGQAMVDALCGPRHGLPGDVWTNLDAAIGLVRAAPPRPRRKKV